MTVESLPTSEIEQGADASKDSSRPGGLPLAVISGVGLLTPLGRTAGETWQSLLDGRFITDHAKSAGEFDQRSPRVIQMARDVAEQALAEAGWADDHFATVVGTSKGSVESWLSSATPLQPISHSRYEAGGEDGQFRLPDARPDITGLADIAAALAGRGPKLTVSAACASGLLALGRAVMMIRAGEARRVLVVAAEASVHPLFLGSFKRLGVLPREGVGCRPFDETRDGFLMSEAAAYFFI
jgi:3-oxoacyl-[acyl-carrier-protein] synthase II